MLRGWDHFLKYRSWWKDGHTPMGISESNLHGVPVEIWSGMCSLSFMPFDRKLFGRVVRRREPQATLKLCKGRLAGCPGGLQVNAMRDRAKHCGLCQSAGFPDGRRPFCKLHTPQSSGLSRADPHKQESQVNSRVTFAVPDLPRTESSFHVQTLDGSFPLVLLQRSIT